MHEQNLGTFYRDRKYISPPLPTHSATFEGLKNYSTNTTKISHPLGLFAYVFFLANVTNQTDGTFTSTKYPLVASTPIQYFQICEQTKIFSKTTVPSTIRRRKSKIKSAKKLRRTDKRRRKQKHTKNNERNYSSWSSSTWRPYRTLP